MNSFMKMEGSSLLTYLSMININDTKEEKSALNPPCEIIFDVLHNSNTAVPRLKRFTKMNPKDLPLLDQKKFSFLKSLESILIQCDLRDENAIVIELLNNMLGNIDNMRIFKEQLGLGFVLELLLRVKTTYNNLYLQTLALFEQMITKFT
jgi:hypothetical protein